MNIGILTSYLALGENADSGIGQHYSILADALAAQGHAVHLVVTSTDPGETQRALAALAPRWSHTVVNARPWDWIKRALRLSWASENLLIHLWAAWTADRALLAAARAHSFAIVETHAYGSPALFFLRRRRRPRIASRVTTTAAQACSISQASSRALRLQAAIERRATLASDAIMTHSRQHCDAVCADYRMDPARVAIVSLGLPDIGAPEPFAALGQEGAVEFLFVGRFELRKGTDVLLAAIPEVARAFPNTTFTLAGASDASWPEFVHRHPDLARSRVRAPGRISRDELNRLYRRCQIFVAPSRYESFGLIYVEAMRCGKPVIGCRAGGIPDVVNHEETGLLAEPGDAASLAACMKRLAGDAELRRRLGDAGRRSFLQRFSANQLAQASAAFYRSVLESS